MRPPPVSRWLLRLFIRYARRYLRRHFNAVRLAIPGGPPAASGPLVLYLNHASWWDPLICVLLQDRFYPERTAYAPMDAAALQRYKFFGKLGLFGIDLGTRAGARHFLQTALSVLHQPTAMLWITPQGRFADVRDRPLQFQSGLGHLAARMVEGLFVPLAVEYTFWEERLPEILLRFGEPVALSRSHPHHLKARAWTSLFEQKLQAAQEELAQASCSRDPRAFTLLLRGQRGVGGIYDWWRRVAALGRGGKFQAGHSDL